MTLIKNDPVEYECNKCKILIFGGFNPTGFVFDQAGNDAHLCRPCYENYWCLFSEIEKKLIEFMNV
jgi:hypothetical protein